MRDKFITPCDLPNEHERELLTILIEECSEVQQRATKMLRFGRDEIQPGQMLTNSERLSLEIGDLMEMIDRAQMVALITEADIRDGKLKKKVQLDHYMQTSEIARDARTQATEARPAAEQQTGVK
jgi:hypothetical protein